MSLPDVPIEPPAPKRPAPSNRKIEYRCSICGREVGRDNLVSKQVRFRYVGTRGKDLKTRTAAWLCILRQDDGSPSCLDKDETWNLSDRRSPAGIVNPSASVAAPGLTTEAERPHLPAPDRELNPGEPGFVEARAVSGRLPVAVSEAPDPYAAPLPAPEPVPVQDRYPEPVPADDPLLTVGVDHEPPPPEGPTIVQGW